MFLNFLKHLLNASSLFKHLNILWAFQDSTCQHHAQSNLCFRSEAQSVSKGCRSRPTFLVHCYVWKHFRQHGWRWCSRPRPPRLQRAPSGARNKRNKERLARRLTYASPGMQADWRGACVTNLGDPVGKAVMLRTAVDQPAFWTNWVSISTGGRGRLSLVH